MFVQIIQGKVNDSAALKERFDIWQRDLQPGAAGYLGATSGVTDDGMQFSLVRFESEEAARANSDRPEQGEWWAETAKLFDGDPTFRETTDVDTLGSGGSDDAGFVQIMQGHTTDRARLAELEAEFIPKLGEMRPDVIGNLRCWFGDEFVHAIYFTNEADARAGESKMNENMPDAPEFMSLVQDVTFIDLKDPWLASA